MTALTSLVQTYTHEAKLLELYGIVNANGTVKTGCSGVTVSKISTGNYRIQLKTLTPSSQSNGGYFSLIAPANKRMDFGVVGGDKLSSPVALTFVCHVDAVSNVDLAATNPFPVVSVDRGNFDSTTGTCYFNIQTGNIPSSGGSPAAADQEFSFRIVTSSDRGANK
jgi:hypothetical protein